MTPNQAIFRKVHKHFNFIVLYKITEDNHEDTSVNLLRMFEAMLLYPEMHKLRRQLYMGLTGSP